MPRTRLANFLLVAAIVAVALNQRPAVVAVAPVLGDLRADTGLSSAMAGLLTTLPVLCFGAFAPLAPRLARRIGLETAVALSLVLLAVGIALRLLSPVALLFAGSLLIGAAIAFANVLLPAYVKREFRPPRRGHGPLLGLAEHRCGGRGGPDDPPGPRAGRGLALGARHLARARPRSRWRSGCRWRGPGTSTGRASRCPRARAPGRCCASRWPVRSPPTSGCRACSSTRSPPGCPRCSPTPGVPVSEGGLLLGLANVVGAVGALLAPAQAGRMRTQRPLILAVALAYVIGLGGLLLAPADGTLVWVAAFGLAQGGGFALALTLIVLRSPTPLVAARLGGVAQCLGYLLAALGPLVLGALHDLTDGWSWPLALLLAALVPMTWFGWGAGAGRRPRAAAVSAASPEGARTPAASADPAAPAGR